MGCRPGNRRRAAFVGAILQGVLLLVQPGSAVEVQDGSRTGTPDASPAVVSAGTARVFLLTAGPGDEVWELFGHNAIWIDDPTDPAQIIYHWGVFNFDEPGFMLRFVRGRMIYSTEPASLDGALAAYARAGREVTLQELALTPAQVDALRERIRVNQLPGNRDYPYDYFRDNCSTRVRDHLDAVLGGAISAATDTVLTGRTFRSLARELTWNAPWTYAGIQVALGNPADAAVTRWDEMFLPGRLQRYLADLTVPGASGPRPLVISEEEVVPASRPAPLPSPPGRYAVFGGIGVGIGALLILLGLAGGRGSTLGRLGFGLVAGLWSLFVGALSLLLLGLWGLTEHTFAHLNENVLQFTPLSWLVLLALLVAPFRGAPARWERAVVRAVVLVSGAGLLLQLLPGFDQMNGELIALALPAHLGLALGISALRGSRPHGLESD